MTIETYIKALRKVKKQFGNIPVATREGYTPKLSVITNIETERILLDKNTKKPTNIYLQISEKY